MTQLGAGETAPPAGDFHRQTPIAAYSFLVFVVLFIVYGSLFPFDFHEEPDPLATLITRASFFGNVADALENFLLFVPLGFALHAAFPRTHQRLIAALLALLVLGLGIQLIQLYLPSRTASLSDVFWNGIGLGVGLLFARALRHLLGERFSGRQRGSRYALLLVALWFFYESFPFVPTLDYGLLREHVKTAIFAPPFEAMRFVQHLLAAMLAGIALDQAHLFRRRVVATVFVGMLAVLLEVFVAYGSLRRETLLGMSIGLAVGHSISRGSEKTAQIALGSIAASAYLLTILTPYRGQSADGGFTLTPLANFLWHNLTRDLPPLAFEALAIGSMLWAGLSRQSRFTSRPFLWIWPTVLTITLLEALRVLVIGLHGDTTTVLIALLLAPFAANARLTTPKTAAGHSHERSQASDSRPSHRERPAWPEAKVHALSLGLLAIVLYLVGHFPGIPYNVRELFPSGLSGIVAALALAAAVYLIANAPFALLGGSTLRYLVAFPLLLPLQGLVVWSLLRIGAPLESIHDIVGAPILDWPWEWELLLRFLALHQVFATQMLGAVLLVATICRPSLSMAFVYWLIVSLIFAWPLHFVVVEKAATDNLVELMRDNGSFAASSLLASGILCLLIAGSAIAAAIFAPGRRLFLFIVAAFALPLSAISFSAGLEPVLVKYGKVFSAAQFLLSPDREHYLQGTALLGRAGLAFTLAMTGIAFLQLHSWHRQARFIAGKNEGSR